MSDDEGLSRPELPVTETSAALFVRPTIKDVARLAGVHFATVSLALRRHPRISEGISQRVHDAAARVGYRPNDVYRALSRHRAKSKDSFAPAIAYVTNRSEENGLFSTAHHRRLVTGARSQAEALGYRLELLAVDKGAHTSASLQRYLVKRGISGVIVGAFQPGRPDLRLTWENFAVVKIDSRHVGPSLPFVSMNQLQGVLACFRQFQRLGYRRIGMAIGKEDEQSTDGMHLSGYFLAQSEIPASRRIPPLLFPCGTSETTAVAKLLRPWVKRHDVDAVMCNWTNIRSLLRLAGFSCPEQVGCACLCLARPLPGFAGVLANLELVGQRAVALLATQMRTGLRGSAEPPTTTYVDGQWHDGDSAPVARRSRAGRASES